MVELKRSTPVLKFTGARTVASARAISDSLSGTSTASLAPARTGAEAARQDRTVKVSQLRWASNARGRISPSPCFSSFAKPIVVSANYLEAQFIFFQFEICYFPCSKLQALLLF
jgi:hypothetical protein